MRRATQREVQRPTSRTISLPAPVKGWNARDSLVEMDPLYAPILTNWFPYPTYLELRSGYSQFATGITGWVETIMQYSSGTTNKLFAAAGTKIYDVTSGGVVGNNYLSLPGTAGNYASTPDSAALDITGDIDIKVYVALTDWTPATAPVLVAKYQVAGQLSYRVYVISSGVMGIGWSNDGTAQLGIESTAAVSASDGNGIWLRFTLDVDDGAGNKAGRFYTSTEPPSTAVDSISWTQLGSTVTSAGTTSIFSGTSKLEVGSQAAGIGNITNGKIYSAYVYDGIDGTLKASFSASDTFVGSTSWASLLTGETWTVNGTAAIAGTLVQTSLTNARWQYVNNTTAGGSYIQAVNGADKMRVFDGTSWHKDGDGVPYDVTGVDSATCSTITLAHNRVWLTQNGTLKAWYGPTGAIGGAFNALDLSSFCQRGGYLMAVADWTMDAGYGMDDMTVFITSNGEILVYRGTDPSSVTTWSLVGRYFVGSPVGRRCFLSFAGDLLLITRNGVQPMSQALQSSRVNARISITDVLQNAISHAITSYGANYGWQLLNYPNENMLILNVPLQESAQQVQYVMNTITRAWTQFTGWNAACWELYKDLIYFGGNGYVGLAWNTLADNGGTIATNGLQAFNYFKSPNLNKQFTQMRPVLYTNGTPVVATKLNINFDLSDPTASASFSGMASGLWDTAVWDTAVWGAGLSLQNNWQGASGTGTCAAPHVNTTSAGINIQWMSTDVVYNPALTPTL